MTKSGFAVAVTIAIGLGVLESYQPDIALFPLSVLAGIGIRQVTIGIFGSRGRR